MAEISFGFMALGSYSLYTATDSTKFLSVTWFFFGYLFVLLQYQLRGDYLQKIKDKIAEDETFREYDVEADTAKHAPVNGGGLFPSSKDS